MWIKFLYENNLNLINISVASDRNLFYFTPFLKNNENIKKNVSHTHTFSNTSAHADQPF
jgi:hypothetical protein